ncbi:DNA polymerase III [Pseudomonas syringae pv. actinidiae]|uniref:DNA polymerase III n=1 Tax=Pseudomonas syringae pv. actinidiae TaxID=103796 RepID=A0AAN4QCQ3_PSESF|nr:DNA polymerase III [Pseudomonas syringae pv. actinidiae]
MRRWRSQSQGLCSRASSLNACNTVDGAVRLAEKLRELYVSITVRPLMFVAIEGLAPLR